jgi:alpha-beta hydrolase superfamily lysophospholipase
MIRATSLLLSLAATSASLLGINSTVLAQQTAVFYKTVKVGDLDIFYREAGPKDAPTVLLLHGFPTSSQMYRNLIPALADKYHVVAPDYPGFGHSSMPPRDKYTYTFDNLARLVEIRPLRARLWRSCRLPPGRRPPGSDLGHRRAEWQRL